MEGFLRYRALWNPPPFRQHSNPQSSLFHNQGDFLTQNQRKPFSPTFGQGPQLGLSQKDLDTGFPGIPRQQPPLTG
jgi:hypothetical protein